MLVVATQVYRSLPDISVGLFNLTLRSAVQIKRGEAPRDFWKQRVRYQREPPGRDYWQTWAETVRLGSGDCEDLACGLTACLWAAGETGARAIPRRIRPGLVHIVVRRADGRIVDPSKALGMRAP